MTLTSVRMEMRMVVMYTYVTLKSASKKIYLTQSQTFLIVTLINILHYYCFAEYTLVNIVQKIRRTVFCHIYNFVCVAKHSSFNTYIYKKPAIFIKNFFLSSRLSL